MTAKSVALREGQIWRKRGPYDWLKILQILDPDYERYDGGCHGARVLAYPPQLKGAQCRGGKRFFIADSRDKTDGIITTWEAQITANRTLLVGFKRGDLL